MFVDQHKIEAAARAMRIADAKNYRFGIPLADPYRVMARAALSTAEPEQPASLPAGQTHD